MNISWMAEAQLHVCSRHLISIPPSLACNAGGTVSLQKEGAMIHSPKHCYPGSGWTSLSSEIIKIKVPDSNNTIEIKEYILSKGDTRQLVYYWYQSRGRVVANEYLDRLYMLFDSLIKKRSDGALIRISGPANDVQKARKFQQQFINVLYPVLAEFLPS